MKNIILTLAIILAAQTEASVQQLRSGDDNCPKIVIENNITIRDLFPKQITILKNKREEIFKREFCDRYYDSYLCKYYNNNRERVLVDTFCLNSTFGEYNCLSYRGCNYKVPGKIINNYKQAS